MKSVKKIDLSEKPASLLSHPNVKGVIAVNNLFLNPIFNVSGNSVNTPRSLCWDSNPYIGELIGFEVGIAHAHIEPPFIIHVNFGDFVDVWVRGFLTHDAKTVLVLQNNSIFVECERRRVCAIHINIWHVDFFFQLQHENLARGRHSPEYCSVIQGRFYMDTRRPPRT